MIFFNRKGKRRRQQIIAKLNAHISETPFGSHIISDALLYAMIGRDRNRLPDDWAEMWISEAREADKYAPRRIA